MKIIVDASVAVEIATKRPQASRLRALTHSSEEVIAPDLIIAEIVNAIWKYHNFGLMPLAEAMESLDRGIRVPDTLVSCREVSAEAFALARNSKHPAYDMFYLALARRLNAPLLSLDRKSRQIAAVEGITVL